jgi:ABC-type transport system substrate-binding protein
MAFENGDLDYVSIPAAEWERIKGLDKWTTLQYPSFHTSYMNMNHTKAPFDDVRVRQAFNYAVNKDDVALAAKEGLADVAAYVGNPTYITYLPDPSTVETYPYNPERARELLAEAGYGDGLTLSEPITTLAGSHFQIATEVIQQQLAEVGVTCEIVPADPSTFAADQVSGNYLFSIMGWSWTTPDWYIYERIFSTGGIGDSNMCFYSNPTVDELFKKASSTADQPTRHEAFAEIIRIVSEDAVMIPLYWQHNTLAWDKGLYADPNIVISDWYWTE